MDPVRYKIYFDQTAATQAQLDRIETVTVAQAMDQMWTATVEVTVTTSDKGRWTGEREDFLQPMVRVRIEVKVGKNGWLPLIDGPVVGIDPSLSSQPGTSVITIRVADDSYYLGQNVSNDRITGSSDSAIAQSIISNAQHLRVGTIENTNGGNPDRAGATMINGTRMQTLRTLALRNGKYVWVEPGASSDTSECHFKAEDTKTSDLPPLKLLGSGRNLDTFEVNDNSTRPVDVLASYLNIQNLQATDQRANYPDVVGQDTALVPSGQQGSVQVRPGATLSTDPQQRALAEARQRSLALDVHGTLRGRCYGGVLRPYRRITVQGVDRLSGDFIIRNVTHTLGRNEYVQDFGLSRRGRGSQSGGGAGATPVPT